MPPSCSRFISSLCVAVWMWVLKETCREAFECTQSAPSATPQQVSETLHHMGLSVEDEVRCTNSGYSIDMIVHDSGREQQHGHVGSGV
jgi:hypothetical protein